MTYFICSFWLRMQTLKTHDIDCNTTTSQWDRHTHTWKYNDYLIWMDCGTLLNPLKGHGSSVKTWIIQKKHLEMNNTFVWSTRLPVSLMTFYVWLMRIPTKVVASIFKVRHFNAFGKASSGTRSRHLGASQNPWKHDCIEPKDASLSNNAWILYNITKTLICFSLPLKLSHSVRGSTTVVGSFCFYQRFAWSAANHRYLHVVHRYVLRSLHFIPQGFPPKHTCTMSGKTRSNRCMEITLWFSTMLKNCNIVSSNPSTSIQQKQGVISVISHPANPYHKVHHSYNKTKTRVTVLCFVASFTTFSSVGKPFLLRMSSTNFPWKCVANLPVAEVSSVIKNQNVCPQTVVVLRQ